MKKRLISALCALLLTGAMLSGCSEMPDKEEKSTVISIWQICAYTHCIRSAGRSGRAVQSDGERHQRGAEGLCR